MAPKFRRNYEDLDAVRAPSLLEIAWAAGIYEGEGSCRNCGRGKRSLAAAVAQNDRELLYRLREMFGGGVGNPNKNGGSAWNICGDRARVFLALIYPYMTVRRKTQIDSIEALAFLNGQSSEGMSMEHTKTTLENYNLAHFGNTWRGNPERRKTQRSKHHKDQYADHQKRGQILARNQAFRDNMTPEQREASQKYQHDYYLRKKDKKSKLVIMEKAS